MNKQIILCLFLIFSLTSHADSFFIKKLTLEGNSKTKTSVILSELNIQANSKVSTKDIENSLANLRNTNLFSLVTYQIKGDELVVTVQEKWTTIPILKLNNGGGVSQMTLGVYDPNVAGRFFELGTQYERLGDTNSGVLWAKNPRLFNKKQGIDLQLWSINRLRTKFEQGVDERVAKTGFLHSRNKAYLAYNKMFHSKYKASIFYEYNKDSFSDRLVPDEVKGKVQNFVLPPSSIYHFLGLGLDYGKINTRSFLLDGSLVSIHTRYGKNEKKLQKNFFEAGLSYKYYKTFSKDMTFAQRVLAGGTTTETLQYWWYLGGLDRIRGFSDNRFAGRYYWLSNSEVRMPFYQSPNFVFQAVSFLDIASVSEQSKDLAEVDGASVGLGVRVHLPKVYRFVIRMDLAKPLKAKDDNALSFGVQQFF